MTDESLLLRIERFERTVATSLCVVPFLFSGQCLTLALCAPVATTMFKDFAIGRAAALAVLLFLLVLAGSAAMMKIAPRAI